MLQGSQKYIPNESTRLRLFQLFSLVIKTKVVQNVNVSGPIDCMSVCIQCKEFLICSTKVDKLKNVLISKTEKLKLQLEKSCFVQV